MMFTNNFSGLFLGWHLHMLFVVLIFLGLIFLILWSMKALDKKQLLNWTITLLVVGVVGMFLTMGWGMKGSAYMMGGASGHGGMMEHMWDEDHEDITSQEEWEDHMLEEMSEHMGFSK